VGEDLTGRGAREILVPHQKKSLIVGLVHLGGQRKSRGKERGKDNVKSDSSKKRNTKNKGTPRGVIGSGEGELKRQLAYPPLKLDIGKSRRSY